jgi:hypothetical protein
MGNFGIRDEDDTSYRLRPRLFGGIAGNADGFFFDNE